ncbi:hypothetical protein [Pseudomonas sp. LS-2]|jgi:hypothetical protein|nr:hypothetical protein [Pseudomonas sp. LS-2]
MLALTLLIAAANPQDMKRYNAKRQLEGWRFSLRHHSARKHWLT